MNSKIPNPNEVLENAKRLFFILLVIDIAITLLVGVNSISTIGMLSDVKSGVKVVDEQLLSSLASRDNFSKLLILSMSGVGIGLVKWLNVCYGFAKESLGATGFKNERWTTTGWLIPFFNLVKPYQIVNEIYKAGSPVYTAPDGWQKESSSGILLTWWVFWALTHLIGASVSKQLLKHDTFSLRQAIDSTELQVAICVVSVVVAGMWFVVSNHLTQRLLIRASSPHNPVKVSPQDCFSPTPPEASNARGNLAGVVAHPDGGDTSFASDALPRHAAQRSAHAETQIPSSKTSLINDSPIAQVLESFYDSVGKELEDGKPDRATWTRAFAESDGDDAKARASYIRLRVAKLLAVYEAEKNAFAKVLTAKKEEEEWLAFVEANEQEAITAQVLAAKKEEEWLAFVEANEQEDSRTHDRIERAIKVVVCVGAGLCVILISIYIFSGRQFPSHEIGAWISSLDTDLKSYHEDERAHGNLSDFAYQSLSQMDLGQNKTELDVYFKIPDTNKVRYPSGHYVREKAHKLGHVAWPSMTVESRINYPLAYRLNYENLKLGHPEGASNLGYMHEHGMGVPIDYWKAAYWYEKAIELGQPHSAQAEIGLANIYRAGLYGQVDLPRARSLYTEALVLVNGPNWAEDRKRHLQEIQKGVNALVGK